MDNSYDYFTTASHWLITNRFVDAGESTFVFDSAQSKEIALVYTHDYDGAVDTNRVMSLEQGQYVVNEGRLYRLSQEQESNYADFVNDAYKRKLAWLESPLGKLYAEVQAWVNKFNDTRCLTDKLIKAKSIADLNKEYKEKYANHVSN